MCDANLLTAFVLYIIAISDLILALVVELVKALVFIIFSPVVRKVVGSTSITDKAVFIKI